MPKLPVLDAKEAGPRRPNGYYWNASPVQHGFVWVRTKGSHRIYQQDETRVVLPYHAGKSLHPKIVKEVLQAIGEL